MQDLNKALGIIDCFLSPWDKKVLGTSSFRNSEKKPTEGWRVPKQTLVNWDYFSELHGQETAGL